MAQKKWPPKIKVPTAKPSGPGTGIKPGQMDIWAKQQVTLAPTPAQKKATEAYIRKNMPGLYKFRKNLLGR